MAIITPQTDVYLLKCPLEINDANQLTFANANAQVSYFQSLPKLHIADEDFTYQRKDGVMRVPALIDDLYGYNYCMYKNEGHGNKWFFAYITGMEYLNDNVTAISLKTDVWNTWYNELHFKNCFVEREHVGNDTMGLHTLPENLELGEYVKNSITATPNPLKGSDCWYCVGVSEIVGTLSKTPASYINGLPNGLYYIFVENSSTLHTIAEMYDKYGKAECIYTMFVFPTLLLYGPHSENLYESATWEGDGAGWSIGIYDGLYVPKTSSAPGVATSYTVSFPTKVGQTYTPKNNKLKCYPFCYFSVSNNAGTNVVYHYEDFSSAPTFNIEGTLSTGGSIKMYPTNYKNLTLSNDNAYDYGVVAGKYPTISWRSDSYTNWITQNGVNMVVDTMGSFAGAMLGVAGASLTSQAGGAAVGFGQLGMIQSGVTFLDKVASNVAKLHQASLIPDQVKGNASCGDINFSKNKNCFTIFEMSIKPEYAKICDDFLSMFGYKVNEVKIPNITGRRNWNYVKTVGCYIEADIPQDDLQEIKSMFDKGVTFWHNPTTFMDYSQNNDII